MAMVRGARSCSSCWRSELFLRVHWVAVPQALHARRVNRCEGMAELHAALEAVEAAEEEEEEEEEGNVFDGPIGRADEEGGLGSSEVAVTLPSSARAPPPPAQLELEPRWSARRATAQSARRAEVRPLSRPQSYLLIRAEPVTEIV
eukprot:COSAG01_NODE_13048_length_1644_cov_2.577346_1_plen_146_part_00